MSIKGRGIVFASVLLSVRLSLCFQDWQSYEQSLKQFVEAWDIAQGTVD